MCASFRQQPPTLNGDQVRALIEEEPGGPDDWLAFLALSAMAQIEPLLDHRPA